LRLEAVAGLGIAFALAVLPVAASAQQITTHTYLTMETSEQGGHTQATVRVAVNGADGLPASGAVIIEDGNHEQQGRGIARAVAGGRRSRSPRRVCGRSIAPGLGFRHQQRFSPN
jgi:hypothetical protein